MDNNPGLLIIGSNGIVAAIDPLSGDEVWRTKLQKGILNSTAHEDVSVLVREGRVFAGCYGHLFCLSLADGSLLWSNNLKRMGYNDVSLAMDGIAVQFLQKTERQTSSSSSGID